MANNRCPTAALNNVNIQTMTVGLQLKVMVVAVVYHQMVVTVQAGLLNNHQQDRVLIHLISTHRVAHR